MSAKQNREVKPERGKNERVINVYKVRVEAGQELRLSFLARDVVFQNPPLKKWVEGVDVVMLLAENHVSCYLRRNWQKCCSLFTEMQKNLNMLKLMELTENKNKAGYSKTFKKGTQNWELNIIITINTICECVCFIKLFFYILKKFYWNNLYYKYPVVCPTLPFALYKFT